MMIIMSFFFFHYVFVFKVNGVNSLEILDIIIIPQFVNISEFCQFVIAQWILQIINIVLWEHFFSLNNHKMFFCERIF